VKPKPNESKQDFLKRCTQELIESGASSKEAFASCNLDYGMSGNNRSAMVLSAPVELASGKENEPRPFLITAYTGNPLKRFGWTIIFDLSGMKSKKKIPVLREHGRDRIVGFGESWKDDHNVYVGGEFSKTTKDAKEVLSLADEGYPWQASMGVFAKKVKVLDSEKEIETVNGHEIKGPADIWLDWDMGEVSFVSLGADDQTAAITFSDDPDRRIPVEIVRNSNNQTSKEESEMDFQTLQKDHPDLLAQIQKAARAEGEQTGHDAGIQTERSRVTEILSAGADADSAKKAIVDGMEASAAYKLFFEAEKNMRSEKLKKLETSAPKPAAPPAPPDPAGDKGPADQVVAKKAMELAASEKIPISDATIRVLKENPDLLAAYEASFTV
jgi:hypothetical protein